MDKMRYPRGLVRYVTQHGLDQHLEPRAMWQRVARPRVLVYTAILGVIVLALGVSIALRSPFRVDVVRDRASLARIVDDGQVENVYRLQVMNATESEQRYRVSVSGLDRITLVGDPVLTVGPAEARWITASSRVPPEIAQQAGPGAHTIHFRVERLGGSAASAEEKSTFMVPR